MSVVTKTDEFSFSADDDRCFQCGETVGLPRVEWHGWLATPREHGRGGTTIAIHPGCAAELAMHLASDSLKARHTLQMALMRRTETPEAGAAG